MHRPLPASATVLSSPNRAPATAGRDMLERGSGVKSSWSVKNARPWLAKVPTPTVRRKPPSNGASAASKGLLNFVTTRIPKDAPTEYHKTAKPGRCSSRKRAQPPKPKAPMYPITAPRTTWVPSKPLQVANMAIPTACATTDVCEMSGSSCCPLSYTATHPTTSATAPVKSAFQNFGPSQAQKAPSSTTAKAHAGWEHSSRSQVSNLLRYSVPGELTELVRLARSPQGRPKATADSEPTPLAA
mmetsp:Transcript_3290/g.10073  ORF Transcript_3290/g.10073 Transcript_3290/m.10073 type:complete len:243 (+) Transcript_3290:571-1299(+)